MRVVLLTQDFPPMEGGTANFLQNICSELTGRGHDVRVITTAFPGDHAFDVQQPYRVQRYRLGRRLASAMPLLRFLSYVASENVDIALLGHAMGTSGLRAVLAAKWLGLPYAILAHGTDTVYVRTNPADALVGRWVFRNAARIFANSAFTKSLILKAGHPDRNLAILNPGVNADYFEPVHDRSDLVRKYGVLGRKVCLTVARLADRKGHADVLEALPAVIAEVPDVIYLIAGKGQLESALRQQVTDLGIADHVRFLGYVPQPDLPGLYNVCDVFVMPSYDWANGEDVEGFGIVYLEANACGKPAIGTRSNGAVDAIRDGETGILVNPHDVRAIAAAITRLLTDDSYTQRLGRTARERIVRNFTWSRVGERLEQQLLQISRKSA